MQNYLENIFIVIIKINDILMFYIKYHTDTAFYIKYLTDTALSNKVVLARIDILVSAQAI